VDRHLNVHVVCHREAVVDRCRRGAPVLVQLQAHRAGRHLLDERILEAAVALAQETQIHRKRFRGLEHARDMPRSRRAGRRIGSGRRPGAAAEHRGDAGHQRLLDLLRADEVNVRVHTAGGGDHAFAGDDLSGRAHNDVHTGLNVGVAGFADPEILPFLMPMSALTMPE